MEHSFLGLDLGTTPKFFVDCTHGFVLSDASFLLVLEDIQINSNSKPQEIWAGFDLDKNFQSQRRIPWKNMEFIYTGKITNSNKLGQPINFPYSQAKFELETV